MLEVGGIGFSDSDSLSPLISDDSYGISYVTTDVETTPTPTTTPLAEVEQESVVQQDDTSNNKPSATISLDICKMIAHTLLEKKIIIFFRIQIAAKCNKICDVSEVRHAERNSDLRFFRAAVFFRSASL